MFASRQRVASVAENAIVLVLWVRPPFINSWIMFVIWFYIALNMTPMIDC